MMDFETLWKTEQELHAAWEKRAYEAEAALTEMRAERDEALKDAKVLRASHKLLTHKIITCGIAATHPNADLTKTGAYADDWDSPQAQSVRELRAELAEARARLALPPPQKEE